MRTLIRRRPILLTGVLALVLAVAGCGDGPKLTRETYEKVTEGMSLKEVEKLLGLGVVVHQSKDHDAVARIKAKHKSVKLLKWESGPKMVTIIFGDDKVVNKIGAGF